MKLIFLVDVLLFLSLLSVVFFISPAFSVPILNAFLKSAGFTRKEAKNIRLVVILIFIFLLYVSLSLRSAS